MNLNSPAVLGLLRGLGVVVLSAVLTYFADVTHLQGLVSPPVAALIASIALGLEHAYEAKTGNAAFGAIRRS